MMEEIRQHIKYKKEKFDVDLALKLNKIIHDMWVHAPHDIGMCLAIAVDKHFAVLRDKGGDKQEEQNKKTFNQYRITKKKNINSNFYLTDTP